MEFPLIETVYQKGRKKNTVYDIDFLGKNFVFGKNNNSKDLPFEKNINQISFFGIKLPVRLEKTEYFNVKVNNITYSFEEGKNAAFSLLLEKEAEEMAEMEIISRKITEKVKNNKYIIEAEYIVLMNIAEEQPIDSDIPWENTDDMS